MAEIDSIEVSYSRKVQLDQFEPIDHRATLSVDIEEGDDAAEVYEEYSDRAEQLVEEAIARRITQKKLADSDDE